MQELERIAYNHHSLLNAMHQMVLLLDIRGGVEYMNPSAVRFLCKDKPVSEKKYSLDKDTRKSLLDLIAPVSDHMQATDFKIGTIGKSHIEYCVAPFTGYRGENLLWLIIRDLTEVKQQHYELTQYRENLETILTLKINELKESEKIRKGLTNQLVMIGKHLKHDSSSGKMVGSSKSLHKIRDLIFQMNKSNATVLITGESGTGKEVVADMVHKTSTRKKKPFLKINCNAINDSLLESELFGYEKGAFTGATKRQIGKFEAADGGTIFLDEIGDISPRMQAALLRILQDGEFMRVGGSNPIKVDVRIIAATNVDLPTAVKKGAFRLDLFYRLNILNISIPPLRERKEDIPDLVNHFLDRFQKAFNKEIDTIPDSANQRIMDYDWPGNVRELENVIQRAVLISQSNIITTGDLIFEGSELYESRNTIDSVLNKYNGGSLKDIVAELEKEVLQVKLQRHQGNVVLAARELKVSKTSLYDKLKRYNIDPKDLR